jgi:UDP-N-acetylglucosamine 2-epimerase
MVGKARDWPNPFGDGTSGERIVEILLAGAKG